MTYANEDFWEAYEAYVKESAERHRMALNALGFSRIGTTPIHLLDLGCGQCMEALRQFDCDRYLGVDLDPGNPASFYRFAERYTTLEANYRDRSQLRKAVGASSVGVSEFSMFSSFFSSEITAPYEDNYDLYEWVFETFPNIQKGVVSGFFYGDRPNDPVVEETGGLKSYQTIESAAVVRSEVFSETRLTIEAPSTLFGPNVYEVWKAFQRR